MQSTGHLCWHFWHSDYSTWWFRNLYKKRTASVHIRNCKFWKVPVILVDIMAWTSTWHEAHVRWFWVGRVSFSALPHARVCAVITPFANYGNFTRKKRSCCGLRKKKKKSFPYHFQVSLASEKKRKFGKAATDKLGRSAIFRVLDFCTKWRFREA